MWAWIFCWVCCATRIFRWCDGKVFEHRVGANFWPSDYEADTLPLRHCTLVSGELLHLCPNCQDFPAVSVVTGSRIFRPYLVVTCRDFPAVSAVTGSRIFRRYQVVTCRDFPAVFAVTGSRIFQPYLYLLFCIFWPYLSRHQKAGIFRPYLLFLAGIFWP